MNAHLDTQPTSRCGALTRTCKAGTNSHGSCHTLNWSMWRNSNDCCRRYFRPQDSLGCWKLPRPYKMSRSPRPRARRRIPPGSSTNDTLPRSTAPNCPRISSVLRSGLPASSGSARPTRPATVCAAATASIVGPNPAGVASTNELPVLEAQPAAATALGVPRTLRLQRSRCTGTARSGRTWARLRGRAAQHLHVESEAVDVDDQVSRGPA
jgi:hypothetical protein